MMREVLSTNPSSYYKNTNLLGVEGDFLTSPEISQLFGEIIGLWCIDYWQKIGCPSQFVLVELGPGRGLLMKDLLRVAKLVPEFEKALTVELIEINSNFKKWQKLNIFPVNKKITWHKTIDNISKLPALIIANEFFDALPIKQYIKIKELWYEINLTIDPLESKIKFDRVSIIKELQMQLLQNHPNASDWAVLEESPMSLEIIRFIMQHIKRYKGASLIIDYGYNIPIKSRTADSYNSTLQAIKNHKYHPLLETLGEADLSAHVDFDALYNVAKQNKVAAASIITQNEFLVNYGIALRAKLLKEKSPQHAELIDSQLERLISFKQMGELFKVLCLLNT